MLEPRIPPQADGSSRCSRHAIPETDLYLERDGRRYPLSQACDLWLIPRAGTSLPRGEAEVVSIIDGHTDRWRVEIAGSASGNTDRRVEIRRFELLATPEAA